jgi:hypothetical protein
MPLKVGGGAIVAFSSIPPPGDPADDESDSEEDPRGGIDSGFSMGRTESTASLLNSSSAFRAAAAALAAAAAAAAAVSVAALIIESGSSSTTLAWTSGSGAATTGGGGLKSCGGLKGDAGIGCEGFEGAGARGSPPKRGSSVLSLSDVKSVAPDSVGLFEGATPSAANRESCEAFFCIDAQAEERAIAASPTF